MNAQPLWVTYDGCWICLAGWILLAAVGLWLHGRGR